MPTQKKPNILLKIINLIAICNFVILIIYPSWLLKPEMMIYLWSVIGIFTAYLMTRIFDYISTEKKFINLIPDVFFLVIAISVKDSARVFLFYLLGRQTYYFIRAMAMRNFEDSAWYKISHNPPVIVLLSFLVAIFIGTLFLMLPISTVEGKATSLLGALFTSTSATCVTGLIVYDTGTHFTVFGQIVILFLIQIGGLGIMTISTAFALMLNQRLSLRKWNIMQTVVGQTQIEDLTGLIKSIVLFTFIIEAIGAAILFFSFREHLPTMGAAAYHAVFHSISSFCNAGFSLYSDSFVNYVSHINVNTVMMILIIAGGIGFPVLVDLHNNIIKRFRPKTLCLHSKIVLLATVLLLMVGFIAFFGAEYNNEMTDMNLLERVLASAFQSVTARTAGFNTIDTSGLSQASVFFTMILMYIGASPGSTGGGIKTTAFFIILISVFSLIRGNRDVNAFKRKISIDVIKSVLALFALSLILLTVMIFLLLLIEPFDFEDIVFEAISAFGTVGLSRGITASLSNIGQMIIIMLMYFGRVGPLTLIFALTTAKSKTVFQYVEEKVAIG